MLISYMYLSLIEYRSSIIFRALMKKNRLREVYIERSTDRVTNEDLSKCMKMIEFNTDLTFWNLQYLSTILEWRGTRCYNCNAEKNIKNIDCSGEGQIILRLPSLRERFNCRQMYRKEVKSTSYNFLLWSSTFCKRSIRSVS